MTPKPVTRWALLDRKTNRLDGETCHLVFKDCLPALFRTRREARAYAEAKYGYIRQRPDLLAEPHCCRVPRAVHVTIAIADTHPQGGDPLGASFMGGGGARQRNRPTPSGIAQPLPDRTDS